MRLQADIREGYRESQLCVRAMSVAVIFEHSCIEEVKQISLVGPRLGRFDYQDSVASKGTISDIMVRNFESWYCTIMPYSHYLMHMILHSLYKLFISSRSPSVSNQDMKCSHQRINITFTDDAERSILDHSYRIPESGRFQAAEPISSQLFGSTTNGVWTLEMTDSRINNKTGVLLEWILNVETQYCQDGYQWTLLYPSGVNYHSNSLENRNAIGTGSSVDTTTSVLTNDIIFTPRYRHTAMAVGNQVFVLGGRGDEIYTDTMKFDYATRSWTLMRGVDRMYPQRGQSAVLTPWGLFTLGGVDEVGMRKQQRRPMSRYDIMSRTWMNVTEYGSSIEEIPEWRYLTAFSYVGYHHLFIHPHDLQVDPDDIHSLIKPTLILIGGDADFSDNRYLPDFWAFSMKEIVDTARRSGYLEQKRLFCDHLINSRDNDTYDRWEWTCGSLGGSDSKRVCDWKAISERAWCFDQYLSFYMPH